MGERKKETKPELVKRLYLKEYAKRKLGANLVSDWEEKFKKENKENQKAITEALLKITHKQVPVPPMPMHSPSTLDIAKMSLNRAFKVASAIAVTVLGVSMAGVPIPASILYIATGVVGLTAGEKALKETYKKKTNGNGKVPTSFTEILSLIYKLIVAIYNYFKRRKK